ncbi:MAG: hypothetical protein ACRECA_08235, partial [Pseudolabrys sp.]
MLIGLPADGSGAGNGSENRLVEIQHAVKRRIARHPSFREQKTERAFLNSRPSLAAETGPNP